MNKAIGEDLRGLLEEMYIKHGHNKMTVAISQLLDIYILEEQKRNLREIKGRYYEASHKR